MPAQVQFHADNVTCLGKNLLAKVHIQDEQRGIIQTYPETHSPTRLPVTFDDDRAVRISPTDRIWSSMDRARKDRTICQAPI